MRTYSYRIGIKELIEFAVDHISCFSGTNRGPPRTLATSRVPTLTSIRSILGYSRCGWWPEVVKSVGRGLESGKSKLYLITCIWSNNINLLCLQYEAAVTCLNLPKGRAKLVHIKLWTLEAGTPAASGFFDKI